MLQEINNKIFFYLSCALAAFFGFIFFNAYVLHSTFVLIGFFQELLTFPALFLLPVLFVFIFIRWWNEKFKLNGYLFWSILLLVIIILSIVLATVTD